MRRVRRQREDRHADVRWLRWQRVVRGVLRNGDGVARIIEEWTVFLIDGTVEDATGQLRIVDGVLQSADDGDAPTLGSGQGALGWSARVVIRVVKASTWATMALAAGVAIASAMVRSSRMSSR